MKVLALSYFLDLHNPRIVRSTIRTTYNKKHTRRHACTHSVFAYKCTSPHVHSLELLSSKHFQTFQSSMQHEHKRASILSTKTCQRGAREPLERATMIKFDIQWVPVIKKLSQFDHRDHRVRGLDAQIGHTVGSGH